MATSFRAPVHLRRTEENLDEIESFVRRMGTRVGVGGVIERLNRQGKQITVPGRLVDWGFTWNDADRRTPQWYPQGITTCADADDQDDLDGRRVLMTSWYAKTVGGVNQGSRITVVDIDTFSYRHVLLVEPTDDGFRPLNVHAGGIVWCGPYLHVAGTRRGLFSCRVGDIVEVADTEATFGYRFVLPVSFAYEADSAEGTKPMRYSFLSLDRCSDPPQLIAGEYGIGDMTRRLIRYPLDPESWHLALDEDGSSRPIWLDERGIGHMQGAALVGDTYYVTSSRGRWKLGQMFVGEPGRFKRFPRSLPVGPEDISYWPGQDAFWSLSEHPGHRYVFTVKRSDIPMK